MIVRVAPPLDRIITLAVLAFDDVRVVDEDRALDAPLAAAAAALQSHPELDGSIAATRAMYKKLGIDPTKTRPSSEALLRRVRKGDPLPRVNTLVDICNWCSVEVQIPYGLYDLDRISGDTIELRLGVDGDEYAGIRKDIVHLAGRPALFDAEGPFGNPTSDSARTMVTRATTRAVFVIYAPAYTAPGLLKLALELTAGRTAEFAGGREVSREVVGGPTL